MGTERKSRIGEYVVILLDGGLFLCIPSNRNTLGKEVLPCFSFPKLIRYMHCSLLSLKTLTLWKWQEMFGMLRRWNCKLRITTHLDCKLLRRRKKKKGHMCPDMQLDACKQLLFLLCWFCGFLASLMRESQSRLPASLLLVWVWFWANIIVSFKDLSLRVLWEIFQELYFFNGVCLFHQITVMSGLWPSSKHKSCFVFFCWDFLVGEGLVSRRGKEPVTLRESSKNSLFGGGFLEREWVKIT